MNKNQAVQLLSLALDNHLVASLNNQIAQAIVKEVCITKFDVETNAKAYAIAAATCILEKEAAHAVKVAEKILIEAGN